MKKFLILLLALTFVLSACATSSAAKQNNPIEVADAWVRIVGGMRSKAGSSTALFMTIQNHTDIPEKLIKIESDAANTIQLHLSEIDGNGVSSMHELHGIDVPAGGATELKPSSYHVMLIGLKHDIKEGDSIRFTLTFQNAGIVTIEAPVKAP